MQRTYAIFRLLITLLACYMVCLLVLLPWRVVGHCSGQFVNYATFSEDESKLLLVTLDQTPFG